MNPVVITTEPTDYGVGATDRVTFAGCSWHVDDTATLHIIKKPGGNVAAFAAGEWRAVVENNVVVASEAKR